MFAIERKQTTVTMTEGIARVALAALSAEMRDGSVRNEHDAPAGLVQSLAQIHFLEIQEKSFVQKAHMLQGRAPQEQARTHQLFDIGGFVVLPAVHPVFR